MSDKTDEKERKKGRYNAEAIRLGGTVSSNQIRFFEAAKRHAKELENATVMAGWKSPNSED
jgi:hypothetical protein